MFSKLFKYFSHIISIYLICYVLLFTFFQFYTPDLGELSVTIVDSTQNTDMKEITITNTLSHKKSYLIVYEENTQNTWVYSAPKTYDSATEYLISRFVPQTLSKYIFLSSDTKNESFSFGLKPRYPVSYMANKEHKFNAFYIVPYKFLIFPTFYFSTHFVFFLDPIM